LIDQSQPRFFCPLRSIKKTFLDVGQVCCDTPISEQEKEKSQRETRSREMPAKQSQGPGCKRLIFYKCKRLIFYKKE
jgi:hypothetical protein